jgi:hypothetical protein
VDDIGSPLMTASPPKTPKAGTEAVEAPHRNPRLWRATFKLDAHGGVARGSNRGQCGRDQRVTAHDKQRLDLDMLDRRTFQRTNHWVIRKELDNRDGCVSLLGRDKTK